MFLFGPTVFLLESLKMMLLLFTQILMVGQGICATLSVPQTASSVNTEIYKQEEICANSACGKYSYTEISSRYPGIFFTSDEMEMKTAQFLTMRQEYLANQGVMEWDKLSTTKGDGDSCCETQINSYINTTMNNILGEPKYIVHMPPKYQFIPHGSCLAKRKCVGLCVLEPITHTLLTYDTTTGTLQFDQFVVPGYCSCKEL